MIETFLIKKNMAYESIKSSQNKQTNNVSLFTNYTFK